MNFEVDSKETYTVIKPRIEKLDTNFAPELKSEVVFQNKNGVRNFILNLEDVKYCDSSGLSAILVANRLAKEVNGTLVISGVQEYVQNLIQISQLHTVLNITPTLSEAHDLVTLSELEKEV